MQQQARYLSFVKHAARAVQGAEAICSCPWLLLTFVEHLYLVISMCATEMRSCMD